MNELKYVYLITYTYFVKYDYTIYNKKCIYNMNITIEIYYIKSICIIA